MRKTWIKKINIFLVTALCLSITGCSNNMETYDTYQTAASSVSTLEPTGTTLNEVSYEGEPAEVEKTEAVYESDDGLCIIEKKPSYYDVYLDYSGGDYRAVGKAYAETIRKVDIDYSGIFEPFLYENIKTAFPSLNGDYKPVEDRIDILMENIPKDYREEMEGFAEALADKVSEDDLAGKSGEVSDEALADESNAGYKKGLQSDGLMSYEEALLMQMIPDCLRGTSCNAFSVWGEKTVSGQKITSRTLEWQLGSENQMCLAQTVVHFNMGEGKNSYVSFAALGMLDMITGISDKDVMVGILDSGSETEYVCEGKKCYTYELRYALENMSDARSIGEYMTSESKNFTFSHNIIITDAKDSFVAEDCVYEMDDLTDEQLEEKGNPFTAKTTLRDKDTPLHDGITWDNPDSIAVVNAFASEGSDDKLTGSGGNYVRFAKYNTWIGEKDKLTISDVKDIVTRETEDMESGFQKLHSENVFQTIIYDYSTGEVEVTFTGVEGVMNHPKFVKVETFF